MATSRTQLGSPRLGSSSGIENRYEYETLEKDDVQRICVLVIDDANDDSSISGTFQLVEIADDPVSSRWAKWDAISYPWEGQDRSESIQINGKPLAVTPNVVAIIKSIRSQRKRLWIDAVCINQEDLTERNHQVQLMRHIYQKASTVVIWLGSNITDAHAWEIHAMADKMGKSPRSGFGTRRYILDSMLTESAWFQRIWVIQVSHLTLFTVQTLITHTGSRSRLRPYSSPWYPRYPVVQFLKYYCSPHCGLLWYFRN